jgi:hypothetical protein
MLAIGSNVVSVAGEIAAASGISPLFRRRAA